MRTETKQLNVEITLSRVSGGSVDGLFNLVIKDDNSQIRIVDLYLNAEELANLFSNRLSIVKAEINTSSTIGKKLTYKEIIMNTSKIIYPKIPGAYEKAVKAKIV